MKFTPRSVSVVPDGATVTVEVVAWDNLSGVKEITSTFEGPPGSGAGAGSQLDLEAGDAFRGTYRGDVAIPSDAPSGTWTLSSIVAVDREENRRRATADSLRARNVPVTLTVRGPS